MTDAILFKVGDYFIATSESYSSYSIEGTFLVLADFDLTAMATEHEAATPVGLMAQRSFLPFLVRRGLIEDANIREVHLGDYGELDPS